MIGAELPAHRALLLGRRHRDDARAEQLADVDGSEPDAAARAVHQQRLAGAQPAALQTVVGGVVVAAKRRRRLEAHRVGKLHHLPLRHHRLFGPTGGGEHAVSRCDRLDSGAGLHHHAGGLTARDERELALVLVLTGDAQQLDEAHAARFDLHLDLAGAGRRRSGNVAHHQDVGIAEPFAHHCLHVEVSV